MNFLDTVRKFNGVDIDQTSNFNHIHCASYIDKIFEHHNWHNLTMQTPPTPIQADNKHQAEIQLTKGPDDPKEAKYLEIKMGFNY